MKPRYAVYFDGQDDYAVVNSFSVYGWDEITIEEMIYPVWPKAQLNWAKFSSIGDLWGDHPATNLATSYDKYYDKLWAFFFTRKSDGTRGAYTPNLFGAVGRWSHIVRRFTVNREYSVWLDGVKKYSAVIPQDEITVLEWDPNSASDPGKYRRFVLGANINYGEKMTVKYAYIRVYSRALTSEEIAWNYNNPNNPVRDGLVLWLHANPRYVASSTWEDISGNSNNSTLYGAYLDRVKNSSLRMLTTQKRRKTSRYYTYFSPETLAYLNNYIWSGEHTIEAKIRDEQPNSSYGGTIFSWKYDDNNFVILNHVSVFRRIKHEVKVGGTYYTATTAMTIPDRSYALTAVFSASEGRNDIYFDGEKVGETTFAPFSTSSFSVLGRVGNYSDAYKFVGKLEYLRIYDRALTQEEVEWNYEHPDNPVKDGLVLWLKADPRYFVGDRWYSVLGNKYVEITKLGIGQGIGSALAPAYVTIPLNDYDFNFVDESAIGPNWDIEILFRIRDYDDYGYIIGRGYYGGQEISAQVTNDSLVFYYFDGSSTTFSNIKVPAKKMKWIKLRIGRSGIYLNDTYLGTLNFQPLSTKYFYIGGRAPDGGNKTEIDVQYVKIFDNGELKHYWVSDKETFGYISKYDPLTNKTKIYSAWVDLLDSTAVIEFSKEARLISLRETFSYLDELNENLVGLF